MNLKNLLLIALFSVISQRAICETSSETVIQQDNELQKKINIDGNVNETAWQGGTSLSDFRVVDPETLENPSHKTEVRLLYDQQGLYVGAKLEQPADTLVARLSARDQFLDRDGLVLVLDPAGKGNYGYWFSLNLGGAMTDGTALPERKFNRQWDGPWQGATKILQDGWSAEYFLPWSMFNMPAKEGSRTIGFGAKRLLSSKGEAWGLPPLPDSGPVFLSALEKLSVGNLSPSKELVFYPFVSSSYNSLDRSDNHKVGFDIFWKPSSNLQLSTTINPDFGNVESDNVDVNLSSFETFFPEKRTFFLEGQEIFTTSAQRTSSFSGKNPLILVNTRRIGSPPPLPDIESFEYLDDTPNQPSELLGAAKLTGQFGNFRYGILSAFEEASFSRGIALGQTIDIKQEGRDFHALRILYERNDYGARKGIGWISTLVSHTQANAYVHGIDGHFLSENTKWKIDGQVLYSDTDLSDGFGSYIDLRYTPKQGFRHDLAIEYYDSNFDLNDFGFLRRNDTYGASYKFTLTNSELKRLKSSRLEFGTRHEYNGEGFAVRKGFYSKMRLELLKNHAIKGNLAYLPSRWDDRNSRGNGTYKIMDRYKWGLSFQSDKSRKLSHEISASFEEEPIGGNSRGLEYEINWQPIPNFSTELSLGYKKRTGWLLHEAERNLTTFNANAWEPELEVVYVPSPKQQFRVSAQWVGIKALENNRWKAPIIAGELIADTDNEAEKRDFTISKLIFQARYRWEIAPLSDLFVVYTRGSDLPSQPKRHFRDLLTETWSRRKTDSLIVKLRYRLGN